ncbi:MAG: hypothetical protein FJZ01_23375 [Candidatus Sericytochromatia bacterium]|nr:hypothetical protein [Candidatus Tanganyikabacteria bacterium]
MKSRQRGNAILISAILVFALTVSALGVSRLLIKSLQGMTAQREFLGIQAQSLAEGAIRTWIRQAVANRTAAWTVGLSKGEAGNAGPVAVTVTVTPTTALPNPRIRATVSLQSINDDPTRPGSKITVVRSVEAQATGCADGVACTTVNPTFLTWEP